MGKIKINNLEILIFMIDLTKVFSAVTKVPKSAIGEFAIFTNEIEDFKNIRERPTKIGYLGI